MAKKPRKRNPGDGGEGRRYRSNGPDPAKMGFGDIGKSPALEWSPEQEKKACERFAEVRRDLVLFEPFFAVLAMKMSPRAATKWEARRINVCATNGSDLLLNPVGFLGLTRAEQIGVVCKSVLHAALKHLIRRESRNLLVWNVACDLSTTRVILDKEVDMGKKSEIMTLPDWVIYDKKKQYVGLDTEAIYQQIADEIRKKLKDGLSKESNEQPKPEDEQQQDDRDILSDYQVLAQFLNERDLGQSLVGESFAPTHDKDGNPIDFNKQEQMLNQMESMWRTALEEASFAVRSSGQGHIPGGMQDLIKRAERPRLPWKRLLREFVSKKVRGGYSWSQPNRRHISRGLYLPSNMDMSLGRAIVIVDTSGSVPDDVLKQFLGEVNDIHAQYKCYVDLVNCDADVGYDEKSGLIGRYAPTDRIPKTLTITGRGGTDFRPPFEWIKDHVQRGSETEDVPAVVIYMTDGMGTYPDKAPKGYPVIWVMTQEFPEDHMYHPPFGEIIYLFDTDPNFS